jgi:3-(3-hydroxy-phenyl)propionate hydroxylase
VLSSTRLDQTEAELFDGQAVERRLQKFIPKEGRYEVVHRNLYNVHQRVAASFRKGRVFLTGDAAHVNNPLGGLGLNFGIHDAIELAGLLGRVLRREASADILDLYEHRRRPLNIEFVQQQTIENKKRMEEKDSIARARNFEQLAATAADPVAHRAYLLRASLLGSLKSRPGPSQSVPNGTN